MREGLLRFSLSLSSLISFNLISFFFFTLNKIACLKQAKTRFPFCPSFLSSFSLSPLGEGVSGSGREEDVEGKSPI